MSESGRKPSSRCEKGLRWSAAMYDTLTRSTERRVMGKLRAQILGPIEGKVLEIGAGTGANLPHYTHAAEVVATEPDPFMLKRAQKRLEGVDHPKIELRQASAEELPFPDDTFDHAVSTLVLCTVPNPEQALAEIRRVLKPGGRFHFVEHVRAEGAIGRVQDVIRPVWKFFAGGCVLNRRTERLISDAGFAIESLEMRRMPPGIPMIVGVARPE